MIEIIKTGHKNPLGVADFHVGPVANFMNYATKSNVSFFVNMKAVSGEEVVIEYGEIEKEKEVEKEVVKKKK